METMTNEDEIEAGTTTVPMLEENSNLERINAADLEPGRNVSNVGTTQSGQVKALPRLVPCGSSSANVVSDMAQMDVSPTVVPARHVQTTRDLTNPRPSEVFSGMTTQAPQFEHHGYGPHRASSSALVPVTRLDDPPDGERVFPGGPIGVQLRGHAQVIP